MTSKKGAKNNDESLRGGPGQGPGGPPLIVGSNLPPSGLAGPLVPGRSFFDLDFDGYFWSRF